MIYVDLDCGLLCESIEGVTEGFLGAELSHVGLLTWDDKANEWYIIEARGTSVRSTALGIFFDSSPQDKNNNKKIIVGRIIPRHQHMIKNAIKYSRNQIGKPYDSIFSLGEDQFYCSELIYYAFNKELFKLNIMTFKGLAKENYLPHWVEYYKGLETPIPEGELGINPGAMSKQKIQKIVHLYGSPDGYTQSL